MSRGIAFSKNKQVKCLSYCSLSSILISLSVIPSCVGANREENGANICSRGLRSGQISEPDTPPPKKINDLGLFCCDICVTGCTEGEKTTAQREGMEAAAHARQPCRSEERASQHPRQRRFRRGAEQVIMITTCSRGSLSLISFLST